MGRAVFLLLLVPLANAAGSQSFFVSRVNEATGICVSKDSFMSAPITDPNSLEKSAKKLSYNSWVKKWTTTNMTEEVTSWFAPYEWEFLPQVTSEGSYTYLTSVNAMGAFFLSILAKDAADVLLTSSKILLRLRIKRSQTAALELYHCADATSDSKCNLAQQDELGLVSMSRKGIHQWEHLGFELHQNSLTVSRIQNFALKQRWSSINFRGVGQTQVSGRASPGLFKPHQGTKLKVESGGAQLQGSFNVHEASSVEFRMRNRLPTRFKQPTLSVEGGGQVQVLNVAAGSRARFPLVNLKAGNSKIVINQWTEGADVKVIYINKILKIYPNDGSVAVGCQFFSHSASDDLEETFADASNRCSHTVSLSANEKEQICKALHLTTTTNGADCSKIRYCSAAPIDGTVGRNDIGNPLSGSSDRFLGRVFPNEFVVGVSVTMTVLCVLSVVLSVLVAVQVKRMVVHEQPHPITNKDYTNETKVDDNDVYEEIGMKNMYQNF